MLTSKEENAATHDSSRCSLCDYSWLLEYFQMQNSNIVTIVTTPNVLLLRNWCVYGGSNKGM